MDFLKAFILAVVEGITEFLPISSTGHMILVEDYLSLGEGKAFADAFMVIIQLPAILAVVVYFWRDLWPGGEAEHRRSVVLLWMKMAVAFVPAGIFGFLFHDWIEANLFNSVSVASALVLGGVVIIAMERREHTPRMAEVGDIGFGAALGIGFFQCLALFPGTSRSAATIIGATFLGASRKAAAEFSFFLAIPTMLAATGYTLLKEGLVFTGRQWGLLTLGSVVSFIVAYAVVAFLMRFIRKHPFTAFGVYRVVLGALVLAAAWFFRHGAGQ